MLFAQIFVSCVKNCPQPKSCKICAFCKLVKLQRDKFSCVEVIYISREEEEEMRQSFFSGINYKLKRYEF